MTNDEQSNDEHQPSTINHSPFTDYHLVGVAGNGMSALAQVLLAQGFRVSGSDRYHDTDQNLPVLNKLQKAGIKLISQDGAGIKPDLSGVVVSTAIEQDNPDMVAARRQNIPVLHRADMLAKLVRDKKLIAVTGTSGKTTVTGMIGWMLEQLGGDPTVINGGPVLNWVNDRAVGNVRIGRSDTWVIELDESDRSLMKFDPDWAVITNISKDHFELTEVESLFSAFARKVKKEIIGCFEGQARQKEDAARQADNEAMVNFNPELTAQRSTFQYKGVTFRVPLLGRHNAENALQSVLLCECLGYELRLISEALITFKGIQRRLERVGEARGVAVVDDYAHNPAKIRAAWSAVQPFYKRVIAMWRPHGYGPLSLMIDELIDTFAGVVRDSDQVYIMPVYFAGGTADRSVTSEMFVEKLHKKGVPAEFVTGYDELLDRLVSLVGQDDVVLFMGARDPDIPVFARLFASKLQDFFMNSMT